MKKLLLLSIFFGFYLIVQAADVRAVTSTPGQLGTLTKAYQSTVTDLIITGTMDARDFRNARDSMPNLVSLDLSGVTIVTYTGTQGTRRGASFTYPANEIPYFALSLDVNTASSSKLTNLTTVILPSNLNSIGNGAFRCAKITSLNIPTTVTNIGNDAISYCVSLPGITIPSSVTTIGYYAFFGSSFTSITIPSSVTSIPNNMVESCPFLTTVNLPSSINSIGIGAFKNLSNLITFNCDATTPPTIDPTSFVGITPANVRLNVPASSLVAYSIATTWSAFFNMYAPVPVSLSGFSTNYGTESISKTFTLYPKASLIDITVTAPIGFEIRQNLIGIWGSSVAFSSSTGNIPAKNIQVRIAGTTPVGNLTGNVVCSSTLSQSQNVTLSGTVL